MKRAFFWFWLLLFLGVPAHGQESLFGTLEKLRATYPTPMTPTQIGALLDRTASSAPGWGMFRKTTGDRCPSPSGIEISCDVLIHQPTHTYFDVLRDWENVAKPDWPTGKPCGLASNGDCFGFVAPVSVVNRPPDVPPIVTKPPGEDLDAIVALLGDLQAEHTAMRAALARLDDKVDALQLSENQAHESTRAQLSGIIEHHRDDDVKADKPLWQDILMAVPELLNLLLNVRH